MISFLAGHPAVDRVYEVRELRTGEIHRPDLVSVLAGGKGFNAARAAKCLGGEPHAIGILGGHAGRWIGEALEAEGIPGTFVWTESETRTCISVAVRSSHGGRLTEFYESSAAIGAKSWTALETAASDMVARAEMLCLCGSLIAGAPIDGYRTLIEKAHAVGVPVAVDSYGPHLLAALEAGPELVKLNAPEAAETLDIPLPDGGDLLMWALDAGRRIRERAGGHGSCVVTCGTRGMVLVDRTGAMLIGSINFAGNYPVGSGDATLAAVALTAAEGRSPEATLVRALAAGAANAELPGAGMLDGARAQELERRAQVIAA